MSKKLPTNISLTGIIKELGETIICANELLQENQTLTQEELRLIISKFAKSRGKLCRLSMQLSYIDDKLAISSSKESIDLAINIIKLIVKLF